MIKSQFIADILDLLLEGDDDGVKLRQQLKYLIEGDYDYTGVGLFLKFSRLDKIADFKLTNDTTVINGVEIKSTELEIGADATLFLTDGLASCLEIWSYDGNYPKKELSNYLLTQTWKGSPGRIISRK